MATTIVWTKSNCTQCVQTKRVMDSLGIPYEERNLENNPEAIEDFVGRGLLSAPIVESAHGTWSGFRLERIQDLKRGKHV